MKSGPLEWKMENLRNKKENPEISKKKKKKGSTHVKFMLVQKSGYSEPLVLGIFFKKKEKKGSSRLDFPPPLIPLILSFLISFGSCGPKISHQKTLVLSRCKMILFINWYSIVDASWSCSSKYSSQCLLWRRKMFVDSYAYKTSTGLHEIFNTNTPIVCKFYKRIKYHVQLFVCSSQYQADNMMQLRWNYRCVGNCPRS